MKYVNYLWRLLATGFSFGIFGIGGLFLTILVFPLLNLVYRDKLCRQKLARIVINKSFRLFIAMMAFFRMFEFEVEQARQQLAKHQGKILIANHPTLIDVVVLISLLPQADCIVKRALWNNPFLKGVVNAAGYIKNSEDVSCLLSACQKSLDAGNLLIIFPEGTRSKPQQKLVFQRGASNIALRCGIDVIPVTIRCIPTTLTKSEAWYSIPERKAHFSVNVGKLIAVDTFVKVQHSLSISARQLTAYLVDLFNGEVSKHA